MFEKEERDGVARTGRQAIFPLYMAVDGEAVRIVSFRGDAGMQLKLMDRALNIGDEIRVVRRKSSGSVVVLKDNNRYMLGGGLAMKINVVPC